MHLFEIVPSELFSILASKNRFIYANALLVLYDAFADNLKILKDNYFSMLRSRLESDLIQTNFDEEGIDEEEARDISGKARFLIRKLKEKEWISIERDQNFEEYIIIPDYSIRILELFVSMLHTETVSGFSYVYETYATLNQTANDESAGSFEKLMAIYSAYDKTQSMIKMLKKVYHNINRYVQTLIGTDNVNKILSAHFDDFFHRIIETHIQPLKIKDSVPKYKAPICRILDSWLENDDALNAIANAALLEKKHNTLDECRSDIVSKIFYIKESYESIEVDYLKEIDDKVRKYTRATTQKIEYLTNNDKTARGNLIYILSALAKSRKDTEILNEIQEVFQVYGQEYLSEKSLYTSRQAQKRLKQNPVLIEEKQPDLRKQIEDEYKDIINTPYSKPKVMEYMKTVLGDSPIAFSKDFNLQDSNDYILSFLCVLMGDDRDSFYKIHLSDDIVDMGNYTLPDIRFDRKG